MNVIDKVVTVNEAANILGKGESTVRRLCAKNQIPKKFYKKVGKTYILDKEWLYNELSKELKKAE
jgi:excisionase family DNA binding protein